MAVRGLNFVAELESLSLRPGVRVAHGRRLYFDPGCQQHFLELEIDDEEVCCLPLRWCSNAAIKKPGDELRDVAQVFPYGMGGIAQPPFLAEGCQ
jgi:hypothetical protein